MSVNMTAKQMGYAFGRAYALKTLQEDPSTLFEDLFVGCLDAAKRHSRLQEAFRAWAEITVVDMMDKFEDGITEGIYKAGWQLEINLKVKPF